VDCLAIHLQGVIIGREKGVAVGRDLTHRTLQDEKDKLFVYKPSDFVAIKEQCARAALIATRIAVFISESKGNRKAGRIYPMLIAEPEIQLELARDVAPNFYPVAS
jgi:hypothetical protein